MQLSVDMLTLDVKLGRKFPWRNHTNTIFHNMEERSSSSTSLRGKREGSYFNMPEPKTGFTSEQDEPVIALIEGKLQQLIKDAI